MGTPLQTASKTVSTSSDVLKYKQIVDQSDMYSHILSKFPEYTTEPRMVVWILLDYIRQYFSFLSTVRRLKMISNPPSLFQVFSWPRYTGSALPPRAYNHNVGPSQGLLSASSASAVPRSCGFEAACLFASVFGKSLPSCSPTGFGHVEATG